MEQDYAKQVIVIRKDLNMRKGKIAAQAAHASMKVLLDGMIKNRYSKWQDPREDCLVWHLAMCESEPMYQWLNGPFAKIVVSVDSEEELFEIKQKAEDEDILCALITDSGKTEFNGVPTNTALAIGPEWASKLDKITGDLKLL